ncbi:MAG: glycosyltransferase family 4 protein [Candidatus Thermoplasmatota archaeon]|nr:glycosyltransferase family 4 protein [Candidatus Thermoplasmatota archaeon]
MKILQGCVRYPPAPGGAETVVKAYSEGLRDIGHDVEVVTTDLYTETPFVKKKMPSVVNGINVTRHKAYTVSGEAHYVLAPGMVQSFLSKSADIIHTHSYGYFQNHAGWIRERFQSTPWVITPHFHPSWSMWGGSKRKTLREFYDTVIGKGTLEAADLITCVSKHEKDMLVSEIGLKEDNIKIIYNGINWADWSSVPNKEVFRKQYPNVSEKFVLFAGRLATNKGLSDLVSAMQLIDKKSVDLVITGADMGLGKQLEKEASDKGVKMHRLGHIDDETYRSVLSAAEMLVLPSEYEAFGIVLLEAAAAKTAVIGTNVGGIPEAMSPGKNGLIVEYNDVNNLAKSIAILLEDEKMSDEMGNLGREWAKNFSWESIVKEIENEYKLIIG